MRSIPNTVTAYPHSSEAAAPVRWIKPGDVIIAMIATEDREVGANIKEILHDLVLPNEAGFAVVRADGGSVLACVGTYTVRADKVDAALAHAAAHHGLPGVFWTHGAPLFGELPKGEEA